MAQVVLLYSYEGGGAIACSENGRDFFRVGTGQPFAWQQNYWLYEYGSSRPLGWFPGAPFYQHPGGRRSNTSADPPPRLPLKGDPERLKRRSGQ